MFKPVPSKISFPELEQRILDFWKEKSIFEKSVQGRKEAPLFVLYEGPPTANASPGVHHVLSRVFKDVIPRYKTMKGYCAPRKAGWDTHGLPVELEVERELGFSSKAEIEAYGIDRFNQRCRQSVFRYVKEWDELTERIGFWLDVEHPYITLENGYIESCWWVIKQLWDKGLIYQGYRVTPHCPRCGTSLSSHEVALGYEEAEDPSVWIKFKLDLAQPGGREAACSLLSSTVPTYFLAWTTTPWTLPANTALAVAPDAQYAVVEAKGERLILAQALIYQSLGGDYEVMGTIEGSDLVGLRYEPLYQRHIIYGEADEPGYRVIAGNFVSLQEGTGIVHIAPAYGEIDLEVGKREGLPFIHVVDLKGHVVSGLSGTGAKATMEDVRRYYENLGSYYREIKLPGDGMFVKDADPLIMEDLKSRGLLYRSETIRHTYPFCWRCETPLLYYAKESWYIRTTAKKERLISANEEINWYPEHIKQGRFGDWLANNVDWAVSRERYWGTPLPIWRCEDCGKEECIGGIEELKSRPGISAESIILKALVAGDEIDLHRPYVDDVVFACPECGRKMRRVPEVIDAWFDSGAMPVAQWHYPFENGELFSQFFPADYICEAVDQTRGWFYTLHALSTLLFDRPCFRNVICLGHILDAQGEKMSKSKGNVVEPWPILNSQGADALRWYLLTSAPAGNVRRFSPELVGEAQRRFILTLWNVYSFFVTYANIDKFDPRSAAEVSFESDLDRWILSELNLLIDEVTSAMEGYDPTTGGRRIQGFVEDLSNWYVRRSRRRFWKSESDADKLAAYTTLYGCLVALSKLLAPLTPFVAEEIYQNLVRSFYPEEPESVHLAEFPIADLGRVDEQLAADTRLAMKVSSLGRAARSNAGIKVRQPLTEAKVRVQSQSEAKSVERIAGQLREELNVQQVKVEFVPPEEWRRIFDVEPNVQLLQRKYGKEVNEVIEALRNANHVDVAASVMAAQDVIIGRYCLSPQEIHLVLFGTLGYSALYDGRRVVEVAIEITPELADEGLARELVHRLQTMRRSAGFDIADYITTYYQGGPTIPRVILKHAPYIKQETLSRDLVEGIPDEGVYTERHRIAGEEVVLGVRRKG